MVYQRGKVAQEWCVTVLESDLALLLALADAVIAEDENPCASSMKATARALSAITTEQST